LAVETNLRIVAPGMAVRIAVRVALVELSSQGSDMHERLCSTIRNRLGLAAVPVGDKIGRLYIATDQPFETAQFDGDDWTAKVADSGDPTRYLTLESEEGRNLIPTLIERALQVRLARKTRLWSLDSARILYEPRPFVQRDGVRGFRRFEISTEFIEGIGVGVAVDLGSAFFSTESVAYYFAGDVDESESQRRQRGFNDLTGRQQGQKGTLLYDTGQRRTKCYFVDAPSGSTCGRTPPIRAKGKTFDSLIDYYRQTYPTLPVNEGSMAVRVSFVGLERSQWVAGDRLSIRIMNDDLPRSLRSVDKIPPHERKRLIQTFWDLAGDDPLDRVAAGMLPGFWRPDSDRVHHCQFPQLEFGANQVLRPPSIQPGSIKQHFKDRRRALHQHGCYHVPPTSPRTLYGLCPADIQTEAKQYLADLVRNINRWAGLRLQNSLVEYNTITDAAIKLRKQARQGAALFVLDSEPTSYFEAAFQLPNWRIKRLTQNTLKDHYKSLKEGSIDRRSGAESYAEGRRKWDSYVAMGTYDVLQQIDAIAWRISDLGPFEAVLAIDVGHDRKHMAASILVARDAARSPNFTIRSFVVDKPDSKHEAINRRLLADLLVSLMKPLFPMGSDPLASLLVLRDGLWLGDERSGVSDALSRLEAAGCCMSLTSVSYGELHKSTQKSFRIWSVDEKGRVENPDEGTAIQLSGSRFLLATTGRNTLTMGTADPLLVVSKEGVNACQMVDVVFAGCQLNWSSPSKAQRLPAVFKRTDEDLETRFAQDVRKIA
jgi:hypothetical protein